MLIFIFNVYKHKYKLLLMMYSSKILEARSKHCKTGGVKAYYQETHRIIFLVILLVEDPEGLHFLNRYLSIIQSF